MFRRRISPVMFILLIAACLAVSLLVRNTSTSSPTIEIKVVTALPQGVPTPDLSLCPNGYKRVQTTSKEWSGAPIMPAASIEPGEKLKFRDRLYLKAELPLTIVVEVKNGQDIGQKFLSEGEFSAPELQLHTLSFNDAGAFADNIIICIKVATY